MKHGAILVSGGRVMGWGINKRILDPYYYAHLISEGAALSIHAEDAVIRSVSRVRQDTGGRYVLYVARVNSRGDLMYSEPCTECQKLIECGRNVGLYIKRVVHS